MPKKCMKSALKVLFTCLECKNNMSRMHRLFRYKLGIESPGPYPRVQIYMSRMHMPIKRIKTAYANSSV